MQLIDKMNPIGVFSIKIINRDGSVDEYVEKNLIMNQARNNMAQLIGGVTTGSPGEPVNRLVLGTEGHVGTNILDYKVVGENGFDSARTELFSEESSGDFYVVDFDPSGGTNITLDGTGVKYIGGVAQTPDIGINTVNRVVSNRTITYTIAIPVSNANINASSTVFTEAALYSGGDIFSMKCFPARVKDDSVEFNISWSLIF